MTKKIIFGILLAPLSFGILLLISSPILGSAGLIGFVFSLLVGYPLAVIVGLPVYFSMRKIRANGVLSYSVASLLFGAILTGIFILYPVYSENGGDLQSLLLPERLKQILFLVFGAFITVFTFWLIVRPDRLPQK